MTASMSLGIELTKPMASRIRAFVGGFSSHARSVTEDVFEAQYPSQSGRVQGCVGGVGPTYEMNVGSNYSTLPSERCVTLGETRFALMAVET